MKKVSGQYKEYSLKKKVRTDLDGDVYLVLGGESESLCAKLLKDHSDAKKGEVEARLQGSGFGVITDIPIDIAFSRGRFAGYIYQDSDAWQMETASTQGKNTATASEQNSFVTDPVYSEMRVESKTTESPIIKWGILAIAIVLLCILNLKVFHFIFLKIVAQGFSQDVYSGCQMLSFSGITSIVGGLVFALLVGRKLLSMDMVPFLIFDAVSFLAGILFVDILLVIIIQLLVGMVSLLFAVLPAVFGIVLIIVIVKAVFKK